MLDFTTKGQLRLRCAECGSLSVGWDLADRRPPAFEATSMAACVARAWFKYKLRAGIDPAASLAGWRGR